MSTGMIIGSARERARSARERTEVPIIDRDGVVPAGSKDQESADQVGEP